MKPLMNKREIAYFKKFLLHYGKDGRKVRVLEWGSGGSTIYYTLFLRQNKIPYLWRSIEYNKGWYEKVRDMVKDDPSTKIELFDVENNALRQRTLPMNEYVDFPKTLNEKFDIIFVDGRKRRRCVLLARELISPDGVVLLHDAQRRHYQCAFTVYPNETFLSTHLWCGKTNEVTPFKRYINKMRSWLYTKNYWYFVQPIQMLRGHAQLKFRLTKDCLKYAHTSQSKRRMLILIGLLALKKKGILIPYHTQLEIGPQRKTLDVSVKDYASAPEFHADIMRHASL